LYELLTGHRDRTPRELVFIADMAVDLRAWPTDIWAKVGVAHTRPLARWSPLGATATSRACGSAG